MLKIRTTPTPYWTKVITKARKRGHFTTQEKSKSFDWVTCACGKQDSRIPKMGIDGGPMDNELRNLGCNFYGAVNGDEFDHAETILGRIERRAALVVLEESC